MQWLIAVVVILIMIMAISQLVLQNHLPMFVTQWTGAVVAETKHNPVLGKLSGQSLERALT